MVSSDIDRDEDVNHSEGKIHPGQGTNDGNHELINQGSNSG
jgi:hypothetical protein